MAISQYSPLAPRPGNAAGIVDTLHLIGDTQEASILLFALLRIGIKTLFQSPIDGEAGVRALLREMHLEAEADVLDTSHLIHAIARNVEARPQLTLPSSGIQGIQDGSLTTRERSVLQLIGQGLSNKRIARNLSIAPETVKSHTKKIFSKLGTQTRAQSVTRAVKLGLV